MNPQIRRMALDLGPLLIFFAAFKYLDIFAATAAFMAAVLTALAVGYWIEK
jgi:intracellular septation protein